LTIFPNNDGFDNDEDGRDDLGESSDENLESETIKFEIIDDFKTFESDIESDPDFSPSDHDSLDEYDMDEYESEEEYSQESCEDMFDIKYPILKKQSTSTPVPVMFDR